MFYNFFWFLTAVDAQASVVGKNHYDTNTKSS